MISAVLTSVTRCDGVSPFGPPVTSVVFSPDGSAVLSASQSGVSIRDGLSLREVDRISPRMDNVHDLRFNHDGTMLAVAGGDPGEQGVVELFSWPDRERKQRIRCHSDVVDCIDFSPDGKRFATASADEACHVYRVAQQDPDVRFRQHSKAVRSLRFLPDGVSVVSASRDETLRVWNADSAEPIRTLHNHSGDVHALAIRPVQAESLPMIASASADQTIRFWQPTIGRMVRFARLPSEPLCLCWGLNGEVLYAGCRDGRVRVVDPTTVQVTGDTTGNGSWIHAIAVRRYAADEADSTGSRIVIGTADGTVESVQF